MITSPDRFTPKQKRSEETLEKITLAIMKLLEDKYFEQITILEIVEQASLSAGTFYRRFKSKEAVLPVLYSQFQRQLREWLTDKSQTWETLPLKELVDDMTASIFAFVLERKGLFRTIYLNARLNPDLLPPETLKQRIGDFERLGQFYQRFIESREPEVAEEMVRFALFTVVNNAIEKCVYPEITPASGCPQGYQESIEATSRMVLCFLVDKFEIPHT